MQFAFWSKLGSEELHARFAPKKHNFLTKAAHSRKSCTRPSCKNALRTQYEKPDSTKALRTARLLQF